MRSLSRRPVLRILALMAVFTAGLGVGAGYMAYGAGSGNTYNACLTSTGNLYRVRVNAKYTCIGTDQSISWNQQGQPGPVGPPGQQGPQGIQGVPGQDAADLPFICPYCIIVNQADLLRDRNLVDAYLPFANLGATTLNGSDLTRPTLDNVDFSNGNLNGTNLTNTTLYKAKFVDADVSEAIVEGMSAHQADFTDATLRDAVGTPADTGGILWDNTTCPDNTNSDDNGNTCDGHFLPLP